MAKRGGQNAGRGGPAQDATSSDRLLRIGALARSFPWPTFTAGMVTAAVILEVLFSAPQPGAMCQDERGYVAHWKTDVLGTDGQPLLEHNFDCEEIGRNTVSRRTTRKSVNVNGKRFETFISVDCRNAEVASKCRRTCGLCPDQIGEVETSAHGYHRPLTQAEADIFHNTFKEQQQVDLQEMVKARVGLAGPHHPSCLTNAINLLEVGKIDPCGYGGELARRQAESLVAIYLEGCPADALCCGTYRQQPGYGPGLFPHYKNAHGWWLFHDKTEHRWMLTNDYDAVEEHAEEILSLRDGARLETAVVPSVKAHAVMTTAGVQPGGQRWLWKMPSSDESMQLWEQDREAWVSSKYWEEIFTETITLTFSLLTSEEEVARFEEYAEEGLELQLEAGDEVASALSSGAVDPKGLANSGCISDPDEGFWCFQVPSDIAHVAVNQLKLFLPSGEVQELFVTADNDGARTHIPHFWAGRVVRVSVAVETQDLASVGLLVCGDTVSQCYGRLVTSDDDGSPQVPRKVVKDWSEGLVQGEVKEKLGSEGDWIRLWNAFDEEGQAVPPKELMEEKAKGKPREKKGHRLQLSGDVILTT